MKSSYLIGGAVAAVAAGLGIYFYTRPKAGSNAGALQQSNVPPPKDVKTALVDAKTPPPAADKSGAEKGLDYAAKKAAAYQECEKASGGDPLKTILCMAAKGL